MEERFLYLLMEILHFKKLRGELYALPLVLWNGLYGELIKNFTIF